MISGVFLVTNPPCWSQLRNKGGCYNMSHYFPHFGSEIVAKQGGLLQEIPLIALLEGMIFQPYFGFMWAINVQYMVPWLVKKNYTYVCDCNFFVSGPFWECFGGCTGMLRPVFWRVRRPWNTFRAPAIEIFWFEARWYLHSGEWAEKGMASIHNITCPDSKSLGVSGYGG